MQPDTHDEYDPEVDLAVEPESEPPAPDPEVREALDRMEEERELPEAEDAADRDEDEDPEHTDDVTEADADEGDEAPTG